MWFRNFALALAAFSAGLITALDANALSVSPIHVEMTTTGNGSRAQITVNNDSSAPVPVEVTLEKFSLDEAGNRKTAKAGDNFLVFPPQALIQPGATQVFRVQWVGDPAIAQSESFMMSVNQIPVKLPAGQSAVQVVMSFGVMINVAPPQGQSELKLVESGVTTDKKTGKRHPTITVTNPSKVHGLLQNSVIRVSGEGWSKTYEKNEITEKVGIGLVQPGKKRKFILPVDLPANVASVQATLDYKPKR